MLGSASNLRLVGEASSGTDALKAIDALKPDLILMDVNMPEMDGPATAKAVLARHPEIKVVAWTVSESSDDLLRMMQVGCSGYVLKDASEQELLDAIFAVYAGGRYFPAHIASRLADRLQRSSLSRRELEVLGMLSKGLTNNQIANALYISSHTVRCHVASITDKLKVSDRTEAVTVAFKNGIIQLE